MSLNPLVGINDIGTAMRSADLFLDLIEEVSNYLCRYQRLQERIKLEEVDQKNLIR